MRRAAIGLLTFAMSGMVLAQQSAYPTKFSPDLATAPAVAQALSHVDTNFTSQVEEWIRINEIPAPSGFEQKRAAYLAEQLKTLKLEVAVDEVGNVVARRRGTGGGPTVVFAAHMDTVHPADTDVTVKRHDDGTLHAPGIFDNSASVTEMLYAARALDAAGVRTKGDIFFLGTVSEEFGLKGMSHWLDKNRGVADMLVAIDGGFGPVNYGALGIYWSRMLFSGEGSHTNSSRGKPHPLRAAARCIQDIYTIPLPEPNAPVSAVYNAGMIRGGNVVNAIAQEVMFTVDLRTVDADLIEKLDAAILGTCEAAAKAERVEFRREWIQKSPAGGRPEHLVDRRKHPLVQTSIDVLKYLGVTLPTGREAVPSGSTDANAGVVRGVPAVSVGRGEGGNQHTITEWANIDSAKTATKQVVLLAVALAELDRSGR